VISIQCLWASKSPNFGGLPSPEYGKMATTQRRKIPTITDAQTGLNLPFPNAIMELKIGVKAKKCYEGYERGLTS